MNNNIPIIDPEPSILTICEHCGHVRNSEESTICPKCRKSPVIPDITIKEIMELMFPNK